MEVTKLFWATPQVYECIKGDELCGDKSSLFRITGTAFAADNTPLDANDDADKKFSKLVKDMMLGAVFVLIFIYFLWSLATVTFSNRRKTVEFAFESLKTLSGFFIGALTGFMGAG
ncbi:MAG: hypothetical protein GY943_00855 [Chloroflexi bacterium]|nr:hypothetical protein [Chloroflexota bacterium]